MKIFEVTLSGLNEIEKKPESNSAAIVIEEEKNKIWIWKGANATPHDFYRASTNATKLKSKLGLYKAKPIIVQEGEEPTDFPL
ncbi:MAG: hypothetical protein ACTSQY_05120 [Candidatus Odinarchaeia archaeon]